MTENPIKRNNTDQKMFASLREENPEKFLGPASIQVKTFKMERDRIKVKVLSMAFLYGKIGNT